MEYKLDEYGNMFTELNGELHSYDDKPAIIYSGGDCFWYKEGKIHRDNGLPAVIYQYGSIFSGMMPKISVPNVISIANRDKFIAEAKAHNEMIDRINEQKTRNALWYVDGKYIKYCNEYKPSIKSVNSSI